MIVNAKYEALPQHVREAVTEWVAALQHADGLAESVLIVARESGVRQEDIRPLARRRLSAEGKRTNHLAIGF